MQRIQCQQLWFLYAQASGGLQVIVKGSVPKGRPQSIDKPIFPVWGCMKGPQPLHISAPASTFAGPGFRFANVVCEPPAAQSAAFEIRRTGFAGSRLEALWASKSASPTATAKSEILTPRRWSGPSGRFLYHFPSRPNLGFAGLGFRFCGALWAVLEPPAA